MTITKNNISDKDLIELTTSLYTAIYILDCFSSNDIIEYEYSLNELEKRGYNIREEKLLVIEKDTNEEEE
jgi:hypothetical protein